MRDALLLSLLVLFAAPAIAAEAPATPDVTALQSEAEKGDAKAQLSLGNLYASGNGVAQDYTEAAKWWRKAADQRNPKAEFNLGQMSHQGQGMKQDDTEAARWYRLAADQGHARAEESLGMLFENGTGVDKNYVEAAKWYEKAANQGLVTAEASLASLNLQGLHYQEAYIWSSIAAAQGDADAAGIRDRLVKTLSPEQLGEANNIVARWKPVAASSRPAAAPAARRARP